MSQNTNNLSFDSLMSFLDWVAEKGMMKSTTASALKAATNKVLSVLDENDRNDLSKIDIDETFNRFKNQNDQGLSPDSLKTYRSRTKKAVDEFLSYRKDPEHWKPSISQRSKQSKSLSDKLKLKNHDSLKSSNLQSDNGQSTQNIEGLSITHQFPLRGDTTVKIIGLPRDIKVVEAKRLSAFLLTLCEDYEPQA